MTRKRMLRLTLAVVFVDDIIRRWFGDTRPIDWLLVVLDLVIVVVIVAEAFIGVRWYCKKKRTLKRIFEFMSKGQQLQDTAPPRNADAAVVAAWIESVWAWFEETGKFLGSCSQHAQAIFQHYVVKTQVGSLRIAQPAERLYLTLESRLENLRSIMEKPDVYF